MIHLPPVAAIWFERALPWIAGLLGCFVVGSVAIYVVRRYLRDRGETASGPALTLSQVRQMRERGEISEREYKALRRIIVSQSEPPSAGGRSVV